MPVEFTAIGHLRNSSGRVLFLNGYDVRQKVMSLSPSWRLDEGRTFLNRLNIFRRLSVDIDSSAEQMVDAFLAYKPDVFARPI